MQRKSRLMLATNFRVGTFCNGNLVLRGVAMTLPEVTMQFSTEARCRELLERLRWPEGVMCPRCKDSRVSRMKDYARFECVGCEYQFTVTSGTIFHDTHLPMPIWFLSVLLICEAKKGMSANQLRRTIWGEHRGSYKTAWYLCHRIRAAMASAEKVMLDGTLEMDETFVGGRQKSTRGHAGRIPYGESNKIPVIGIKQRGGELRFFKAEDVKSGTLAKYIKENVSEDVDLIMTDEWQAYPSALDKAGQSRSKHKTVKHRDGVYADGDITTNGIESAFSLLKRGIVGSWHKVSAKHLPAYLEEMTFRFNRRGRADLFIDTLRHMVTSDPLTFENLTA
jgi:transposase-like protein